MTECLIYVHNNDLLSGDGDPRFHDPLPDCPPHIEGDGETGELQEPPAGVGMRCVVLGHGVLQD